MLALYEGNYDVYDQGEKIEGFDEGKIFYISLYNKKLLLSNVYGPVGSFDQLAVVARENDSKIQVSVVEPKSGSRNYTGNLKLHIEYGRILIINETDIEQYISGVVEAESGVNALPEFQKAQALLCRTYLQSHINRHESEGFNLCDEVHCQAFKGFTPYSNIIYKSTSLTRNKVIVSADNTLITASFHGNCGGETQSSDNTWIKNHDYLVPVKDPYCKQTKNNSWEKEIPLQEWKAYLKKQGINTAKLNNAAYEMKKTGRQLEYKVNDKTILTQQIRADWNLKSSYFQVIIKSNSIVIKGHGYGHGVGMCQDGAMKMATLGKTCDEIINFYFKGVRIVDTIVVRR